MRIDIITGFPKMLKGPLNESILRIGQKKGIVKIFVHDLRDYTDDKHRTIDDYPYGGGPGMVLMVEPIVRALRGIFAETDQKKACILLTSPRGKQFKQDEAVKLSLKGHLVILCGHYKGIDERIHDFFEIEDISIGDYILSAGETAALVIVDAVVRLLPGVIKDIDSAWTDSFNDYLLDAPYYTRPEIFENNKAPEVLLSGNHKNIDEWRRQKRKEITKERRPDLYKNYKKLIK
jgi:tRNA (guanine37-N1)-methyltransferase